MWFGQLQALIYETLTNINYQRYIFQNFTNHIHTNNTQKPYKYKLTTPKSNPPNNSITKKKKKYKLSIHKHNPKLLFSDG